MNSNAGLHVLTLAGGLLVAIAGMPAYVAVAQETAVASEETAAAPEEAAEQTAGLQDPVEQPIPVAKPAKSDLDQSAVRRHGEATQSAVRIQRLPPHR